MGQVLVDSDSLTAIGDAIRKKTNQVIKYKPAEMPAAINSINSLKLGGYKVNITQSDHQTIHVTQSTFNDQESGFTIEDHPTINISLTADPGYIAGSLNLTNFTFSNDVREVDIFATPATYSPNNITYNGNMNVIRSGASFNITSASSFDSINHYNEAFDLELCDYGDTQIYELRIGYKDNFYSLDPETEYKIVALKIGDTSLSSDDLADGNPTLSTVSAHINADLSKDWVKSVYRQCTGKEIRLNLEEMLPPPNNMDEIVQMENSPMGNQYEYIGDQVANRIYRSKTVENTVINALDFSVNSSFIHSLSHDIVLRWGNNIENFLQSNIRTGNLVQGYYNTLMNLRDRYANDEAALAVLDKYWPLTNDEFKNLDFDFSKTPSPALVQMLYTIDPSDKYRFLASLTGGLAYVVWLFYLYYVFIEMMILLGVGPSVSDDPIISTIPVSITFTNTAQQ